MVSQLRNDRLPLRISNELEGDAAAAPATWRARRGPKTNNGATSSTRWLKSTPTLWAQGGRQWSARLSGFGIGWVSKW